MHDLLLFDCNASYGPRPGMHPEERWTLAHLLEDLDLAGIAGALALHAQAAEYDPMIANRRLLRDIEPHRDRLFPCWYLLPDSLGDMPPVSAMIAEMERNEVRAVRLEPATCGLPVRESVWGDLRDALRDYGALVTTSMEGFAQDLDAAHRFFTLFSGCNLLLTNASWSQWRSVEWLLREHPTLHLEFSMFQGNRAMEIMARQHGVHRCLFGTGLPRRAPGAARGFLDWSLLPRADVQQIGANNLRHLLRDRGPATIPEPGPWHDELTTAARRGAPLPCQVLDAHCHMLHEGGCSAGRTLVMPKGGPGGMLELMDRIGIDRAAVMSWAGPLSGDPEHGNQIVADAVDAYPQRFLGLPTIRPEIQNAEDIRRTIDEYHVRRRFPGLKPFPRETLDFDHPGFAPWFRYADEHRLYMVFDPSRFGDAGTPLVEHLASRYPNLCLHLDHCGKSWPYARWAVDMCRRFPQVVAQLNYTLVTNGVIEYLVDAIGSERVFFGTDAPMRDPRPQAAWLTFTRLAPADKKRILGGNFAAILKRAYSR